MIRPAQTADAAGVAEIYNHYVLNTLISFEQDAVSADQMLDRIRDNTDEKLPWLVAEDDQQRLVGFAYASRWKGRCAYRFAVEVTVYLAPELTTKGWGTALYQALFAELQKLSLRTVIGGIALPNPASIALHEKFGMQKVAHFKEVGFKFDRWVDVGYWQGQLGD